MNVLIISAWYPTRYDAMSGLFVRKHAVAVSKFCNAKVLHIHQTNEVSKTEIINLKSDNLSEIIIYLPLSEFRLIKFAKYFWGYYKGYKILEREGYKPDLIHANILTRVPFFALFLKIFHTTPYVITEHWSRFLPHKKSFKNYLHKLLTKIVVNQSSSIMVVSEILKDGMLEAGLRHNNYFRINNVVDDFFFLKYETSFTSVKKMLHISCFDEQAKNTIGILKAIHKLSSKRADFQLVIAGNGKDFRQVTTFAQSLNINKNLILFTGEKTPEEIAELLLESCCLVQFSNYETAGVTIAEALASGKPVISSKVGIAPEYINETNGILVEPNDETELVTALNSMLDKYQSYNNAEIQKNALNLFSFNNVGKEIFEIYRQAIKNQF